MAKDWQPDKNQKKVLTQLRRDLERSKSKQQEFLKAVAVYDSVYLGEDHIQVERDEKGLAKDGLIHEFTPYGYQQLETAVPRFLEQDSQFDVIPRKNTQQYIDGAKASRQLLDAQMEQDNFANKKEWWVRRSLRDGLSWAHVIWDEDYVTKKVRKPKAQILEETKQMLGMVDEEGNPVFPEPYEEREVCLFEGPKSITVSPEDIRYDPDARSMDDCEFVFYRIWLTKDQLEKRRDKGIYDNVDCLNMPGVKSSQGRDGYLDQDKTRDGFYEIWEKWTRDRVVTYAEADGVILADRPNPYHHGQIPFVPIAPNFIPDQIVGQSEMWAVRALQRTAWFLDNAALNLMQLGMNPPVEVQEDWAYGQKLQLTPGERIPVEEVGENHFKPVVIDYRLAENMASSEPIIDRIYSSTGINRELSASPVGSVSNSRTATQALQQNREANARMALKMMRFNAAWVKIAEFFLELSAQFVTEDQVLEIASDVPGVWETITIDSDHLTGCVDYKFKVKNSTEILNQELAKQTANEVLQTLAQFSGVPMSDGSQLAIEAAIKDYLVTQDLDPERYFVPAQPIDPATGQPTPPAGYAPDPATDPTVAGLDPATGLPLEMTQPPAV